MKYLFVSSDKFPPFRVDLSELFGKEMVSLGHKIDFVLQSSDTCQKSYSTSWSGCRVFVGAKNFGKSALAKIKKHLLCIFNELKIIRLIKYEKYDFIIIKDKFVSGVVAAVLTYFYNIPLIYWLSFPFPEENIYRSNLPNERFPLYLRVRGIFFKYLLYKLLMPCATHIFVQSDQMKQDICLHGIEMDKMTSVPMGVSNDIFFQKPYQKVSLFGDHPKVVYLGTLSATRRIDFLIRTFKYVHDNIPNAILYLVGRGDSPEDEKLLKMEAYDLGIESSVIFTGFLPRPEALNYIQQADACVSPFFPTPILNSTSPTKVVEYMAMQKPVVANDHPEQKAVLSSSQAGICVPYDEKAFSDAICYLLTHPDEALEMGKRGRQYVMKHRTYGAIAKSVHNKLQNICL